VARVVYPGLPSHPSHEVARRYHHRGLYGALVGLELAGGRAAGQRLAERTRLFSHLANIGDARSLIIHPASTTHSQLSPDELAAAGVSEGFVRLSVGLETLADLLDDLDQALRGA